MTRRILFLSFISLCASAVLSLKVNADDAAANNTKIQIGVILPLTGDAASLGKAYQNGLILGLEDLKREVRERLQLTVEDDGLVAKNSVQAFYKLKNTNAADVLLNVSSGTGLALATLAEKTKTPFIAVASDPEVSKNKIFTFSLWVTPDAEAKVALDEAVQRRYKKVARITTLHNGPISVKDAVNNLNHGRLRFVDDQEYATNDKDFRTYLTKIRTEPDLDAIMVILLPGQCGEFARQARQMGIKQPLFGFEIFEDANEVKLSDGALVGQWYVNGDDPDNTFISRYRARFPGASTFGSATGHDAILLIGKAIEQGYPAGRINEYLANVKDFHGALGVYSASGDHRFTLPAAVKVVTKTGFEKVH